MTERRQPTVTVAEVAVTLAGGTPPREERRYFGGDIPWVKSGEVARSPITETDETLTAEGLSASSAKWCEAGSTLIAMYGATAGVVGRLGIRATTNQAVLCVQARDRRDEAFLYHALKTAAPVLLSRTQGSGQPNLNAGIISKLRLPWPDRRTRKRLCQALDAFDVVLARMADIVTAKRVFKRGLMHELLTARRRFPEFEDEWQVASLGDLVSIKSGQTPARAEQSNWKGHVPWVTAKDMKSFFLSSSKERLSERGASSIKLAAAGDALVLVRGNLAGTVPVGVATVPLAFNQDVKALKPKQAISGEYLARYLEGLPQVLQQELTITGHGVGRLDTDQLSGVNIRFPSREEQDRITSLLRGIDNELRLLDLLGNAYESQKRALMRLLLSDDLVMAALAESEPEPAHV